VILSLPELTCFAVKFVALLITLEVASKIGEEAEVDFSFVLTLGMVLSEVGATGPGDKKDSIVDLIEVSLESDIITPDP
jgi:hypothetical protein